MKYQIIILILTIFINNTFGQRFVLPENEENVVYESQGSNIRKIQSIDFPITKQLKLWKNKVFCLDTANSQILIADLFLSNINEKIIKDSTDQMSLNPISISVVSKALLLMGAIMNKRSYTPILRHQITGTQTGYSCRILAMFGKSVDDFMDYGDTLIAVDTIVMPQYPGDYDIRM
jgi:hypothetical protein